MAHSVRINILFSLGKTGQGSRRFSRIGLRTDSHPLAPVGGSTQAGYRSWINHVIGVMMDFAEDVFVQG